MALELEAVIYSQDSYVQGCNIKDLFSSFGSFNFDPYYDSQVDQNLSCSEWDRFGQNTNNSYPEPAVGFPVPEGAVGEKKRRRRKSTKNKEEVENQRMTHITVERNRRKQMNHYLSAIRSLMPPSYVQRGDQASIVGGAINYVKELEQLMQSLEAQKSTSSKQQQPQHNHQISQEPFSDFFRFPQYTTRRSREESDVAAAGEIEVNMADTHATVKILTERKPKQLLKLVAGFQALRLSVLHVNLTTLDAFTLYSFTLKVEEGCHLKSVEEIAGAANHMLGS